MRATTVLAFTSAAVAAPTLKTRDAGVVGTIMDAVSTLEGTTSELLGEITSVVDTVTDIVDIEDILDDLKADYTSLASALNQAGANIADVTVDATGSISDILEGLTQEQLETIAKAVGIADDVLEEVTTSLTDALAGLDLEGLLDSELSAVTDAIEPFISPLAEFADAALGVATDLDLDLDLLKDNLGQVTDLIESIVGDLDLPIELPDLPILGDILGGILGGILG